MSLRSEIEIRQRVGDLQSQQRQDFIVMGNVAVPNEGNNFSLLEIALMWALDEGDGRDARR